MSEINAQNTATETEAKNFYEWLESNKAGFDSFMSKVYDDSPFPPAISNNVVAKFKVVNRALKATIYAGHGLMFSAAILWEKVKPTLTPEQIEQFKQADLKTVSGHDIFDMIAGIAGKDEATRQMKDCIDKMEQKQVDVPTCPASDPKDYSV
jgi:trehalose-6-phosphate synthase